MIELPEAIVLTEQINNTLIGKRIMKVTANHTPHSFAWYTGNPEDYHDLLAGKTIQATSTFGCNIEIFIEDMILHLSTPVRYHAKGEKLPKKHQLLLEFEDSTAASATVQMWGALFCFKKGESYDVPDCHIKSKDPSPLSDGFDRKFFDSLFNENTQKLSAKAFLATEQRIPGLGNGVLQDILWTAKIHPQRKMSTLSDEEIQNMYNAIKSVLGEMVEHGGRNTERDLFGGQGGYNTILCKNTVDKPCPRCGAMIKKKAYLGGSIYFCENCQHL